FVHLSYPSSKGLPLRIWFLMISPSAMTIILFSGPVSIKPSNLTGITRLVKVDVKLPSIKTASGLLPSVYCSLSGGLLMISKLICLGTPSVLDRGELFRSTWVLYALGKVSILPVNWKRIASRLVLIG